MHKMEAHLAAMALSQETISKLQDRRWYFVLLLEMLRWVTTLMT